MSSPLEVWLLGPRARSHIMSGPLPMLRFDAFSAFRLGLARYRLKSILLALNQALPESGRVNIFDVLAQNYERITFRIRLVENYT